jgi:hypothetical protein
MTPTNKELYKKPQITSPLGPWLRLTPLISVQARTPKRLELNPSYSRTHICVYTHGRLERLMKQRDTKEQKISIPFDVLAENPPEPTLFWLSPTIILAIDVGCIAIGNEHLPSMLVTNFARAHGTLSSVPADGRHKTELELTMQDVLIKVRHAFMSVFAQRYMRGMYACFIYMCTCAYMYIYIYIYIRDVFWRRNTYSTRGVRPNSEQANSLLHI